MQQAVKGRIAARAAVGVLAMMLCAGCSFSVGSSPETVSKEEVAEKASKALAKQVGREPDDVTCDEALKAEVSETVRCTLTADGQAYGLTVTAKSVTDGRVDMDFKVDDSPKS
ncbi:DUF4333 domain-containing protein [Streptomyces sp. LHD-70]|uniref:DUF4333 domain-containing protein n=1 Tax=Streptomyces sp. LHD-70 TaxID=3072140 RepID=UPI00280F3946|nr:DUF4333 domain-containing protein [Streptomyces sp. LHD-70]MDQ8705383.1 DUF4333 domain-containing protein [Streptomyces sp. LHD-70]